VLSLAALPAAAPAATTAPAAERLAPAGGDARLIKTAWVYERRYHTVRRWVPRRHHYYAYYERPYYRHYHYGYYAPPPVVYVGPGYGYDGGWGYHHHWRRW
jgi:hypothetical protein